MRTLTDDEVVEEAGFIRRESGWPNWPVLPVKHINRGDRDHPEDEDVAIMVAGAGPKVFLVNMLALHSGSLKPQLEGVPVREFETIEDLVRAGWIAD